MTIFCSPLQLLKKASFVLTLLLLMGANFSLVRAQQPTTLVVRAKAKDAKFIGSSMGGAYVIVREALTGKILAEGFTKGSTGNTSKIMKEPQTRYTPLADEQTAKFETTLQLEKPLFVTVEVVAPYDQPGARVQAQTQLWLLPGKNIVGDGLVLEIPGFVVNALAPQTHETLQAGQPFPIKANVVMMCGCTISPDGLWNSEGYEVEALVYQEGKLIRSVPLAVQNKNNTFEGSYTPTTAGLYEIILTAFDPKTGNTGLDKVNILVEK